MRVINFFLTTTVVALGLAGFDQLTKQYAKRRAVSMLNEMKQTGEFPDRKEFL